MLKHHENQMTEILNQRLIVINQEIQQLRNHQRAIVHMLGNKKLLKKTRTMTKSTWIKLLQSAGLNEQGMLRWHQEFEQAAPKAHQDFLESLGLEKQEIIAIRKKSRANKS